MTMTPLRRRGAALAAALLSTALVLTACGTDSDDPGDTAGETRTIEADYGVTVEVPADPQRVAVLHPAYVDMALDLGVKPVAVTALDEGRLAELPPDQQAAHNAATNVASSSGEVDLEALAALEPDVIINLTGESGWQQQQDEFSSIAPTVPVDVGSVSDVQWRVLAEATNTVDALNEHQAHFEERVAEIQQTFGEVLEGATVVEVTVTEWSEPGTFSINGSLCAEVIIDEDVIDFAPSESGVSYEQFGSLADYDLILYNEGTEGQLTEENAWKTLPAVQSGHAQPLYCPFSKTYYVMDQYLDGLEAALATLPRPE